MMPISRLVYKPTRGARDKVFRHPEVIFKVNTFKSKSFYDVFLAKSGGVSQCALAFMRCVARKMGEFQVQHRV